MVIKLILCSFLFVSSIFSMELENKSLRKYIYELFLVTNPIIPESIYKIEKAMLIDRLSEIEVLTIANIDEKGLISKRPNVFEEFNRERAKIQYGQFAKLYSLWISSIYYRDVDFQVFLSLKIDLLIRASIYYRYLSELLINPENFNKEYFLKLIQYKSNKFFMFHLYNFLDKIESKSDEIDQFKDFLLKQIKYYFDDLRNLKDKELKDLIHKFLSDESNGKLFELSEGLNDIFRTLIQESISSERVAVD